MEITMDMIRKMKRRELTPIEKTKPYARIFYKEIAEIPAEDLARANGVPIDAAKAISIQNRSDLLKPGYQEAENGFTVMSDGTGYAATLVKMPGVTPEMLDWWFNWHPLEGLRYAMWSPGAHFDISVKDPEKHRDSSGIPLRERNFNTIHYVLEGLDIDNKQNLRIEFFTPQDFGLNMDLFVEPNISRAYAANVIDNDINLGVNVFFHAIRTVNGVLEYRSRYWIGYTMKNGKPEKSGLNPPDIPNFGMIDFARGIYLHSLTEYNNLASFLPELYAEIGGKID